MFFPTIYYNTNSQTSHRLVYFCPEKNNFHDIKKIAFIFLICLQHAILVALNSAHNGNKDHDNIPGEKWLDKSHQLEMLTVTECIFYLKFFIQHVINSCGVCDSS